MKPTFYLYGSYKEGRETLPDASFSFVVDDFTKVVVPSFLIWQYRETDGRAIASKSGLSIAVACGESNRALECSGFP
jgi:hypothetical protein